MSQLEETLEQNKIIHSLKESLEQRLIDHSLHHSFIPKLMDASNYTLFLKGKRLRPMLFLCLAHDLNTSNLDLLDAACALEYVHTYSLIHDDLPLMDNDDFRRGVPSLHKAFDPASALLVGNGLLLYAFELLASSSLPDPMVRRFTSLLAKASGLNGMIAGQYLDIHSEGRTLNSEELQMMYYHKTAALIICSVEFALIAANADSSLQADLLQGATQLGIAFQIANDLEEKHDKVRFSDLSNQKATCLTTLGEYRSKKLLKQSVNNWLSFLEKHNCLCTHEYTKQLFHKVLLCTENG